MNALNNRMAFSTHPTLITRHVFASLLAVIAVVFAFAPGVIAQPIDMATATGEYAGGGVVLTADALRDIVRGDEKAGGVRGGGTGDVLIVECSGAFGYGSIQSAIDAAEDGDVVVVLPNDCTPEERWFENVVILDKAIRVQSANPVDAAIVDATIIDGCANGSVIRIEAEGSNGAVIDGLTLTNGRGENSSVGGGITCYMAAPTIRRCTLWNNASAFGGGLRVISLDSPHVESCRFIDNMAIPANGNGSAVAASQSAYPLFTDCAFSGHGGIAVWLSAVWQESCEDPSNCASFAGCRFEENDCHTLIRGDSLTFHGCSFVENTGALIDSEDCEFTDCEFTRNDANGETLLQTAGLVHVTGSVFVGNTATSVLRILATQASVSRCRFESNHASAHLHLLGGEEPEIVDCEFLYNMGAGSLVVVVGSRTLQMEGCRFVGFDGAPAMRAVLLSTSASDADIRHCEFRNNRWGAIVGADESISDCLFVGNSSNIYRVIHSPNADVQRCTVVGNRDGIWVGTITNSIVYHNRSVLGGVLQSQEFRGKATYCNIESLTAYSLPIGTSPTDPGNFSLDPHFVDPGSWDDMGTPDDYADDVYTLGDYHLLAESPCIDGGDPAYAPVMDVTDFDGEPRVMSCRVDMGVDEFPQDPIALAGDFNSDGDVTIDDVSAFLESVLSPIGIGVCRADLNGDGFADGLDVAAMAALLLGM